MTGATIDTVAQAIRDRGGHHNTRVVVAIAGAPGSGKSTLAHDLAGRLGPDAAVLPMDGFHLDNTRLEPLGLLARKGAPQTFDAAGFVRLVGALRGADAVPYPTFDRARDITVPGGGEIAPTTRFVLVEGNYLLLRTPPWSDLKALFDLTVFLNVPEPVLKSRLVARWLEHGLSPDEALARAQGNDMINARLVLDGSAVADFTVVNDA